MLMWLIFQFEIDFQVLYKDTANSMQNRWEDISALLKKELEKEKIKCGGVILIVFHNRGTLKFLIKILLLL